MFNSEYSILSIDRKIDSLFNLDIKDLNLQLNSENINMQYRFNTDLFWNHPKIQDITVGFEQKCVKTLKELELCIFSAIIKLMILNSAVE